MNDELCLEDDGDIGIDWATPERDMLTISLNPRGGISYAILLSDGTKVHGKCQMHPLAFVVLKKLVPPTDFEDKLAERLAAKKPECKHENRECTYESDDGEFERWQCKDCGARWGVEIAQ
jgi:hypothetical protein